jgi:hypothetical protein
MPWLPLLTQNQIQKSPPQVPQTRKRSAPLSDVMGDASTAVDSDEPHSASSDEEYYQPTKKRKFNPSHSQSSPESQSDTSTVIDTASQEPDEVTTLRLTLYYQRLLEEKVLDGAGRQGDVHRYKHEYETIYRMFHKRYSDGVLSYELKKRVWMILDGYRALLPMESIVSINIPLSSDPAR